MKITAREIQDMAISSHISEEEFQKWLEENKNALINASEFPVYIQHRGIWQIYPEPEGTNIPLEQDENGTYGYKVLVRIPESPWFWSPNRYWHSEWVDNRLTAHTPPRGYEMSGIYATKKLGELVGWYKNYLAHFATMAQVVPVKIRVWGVVIEHIKGFRAEHAEIVEVLDGHW